MIRQKEESGCWFPPAQHYSQPAKQKSDPIWKIIFYNSNKYFFSELQLLYIPSEKDYHRTKFNNNMNFKNVIYLQNCQRPPGYVSCYYTWKAVIWLPAARWIGRFPDSHWLIFSYPALHWPNVTTWHMSHDPWPHNARTMIWFFARHTHCFFLGLKVAPITWLSRWASTSRLAMNKDLDISQGNKKIVVSESQ